MEQIKEGVIYCKGVIGKGKEVIDLLVENGGKVDKITNGCYGYNIYYIAEDGIIDCTSSQSRLYSQIRAVGQELKIGEKSPQVSKRKQK